MVNPGSYTPPDYLEQTVSLAQLTKSIRHKLYTGPIQEGQPLSLSNFEESLQSLKHWLDNVPPHLGTNTSVPNLHRRPVALLHLRYWSTVMLVARPFLLCSLLRKDELHGTAKQPHFDRLARTCVSAAEASLDIFEGLAHGVLSSIVLLDFLFSLQVLQVVLVASSLYPSANHRGRARRCISVLEAIGAFGFPKHMLPEILLEAQGFGILDGIMENPPPPPLHGGPETTPRYLSHPEQGQDRNIGMLTLTQGYHTTRRVRGRASISGRFSAL